MLKTCRIHCLLFASIAWSSSIDQRYNAVMGDGGGITISLGDSLPYLEQRFLGLFGRDAESKELAEWFKAIQKTAIMLTANVQCLGMKNPVPFDSIYQPTRLIVGPDPDDSTKRESFAYADRVSRSILRGRTFEERAISVEEFLQRDDDALIFSGPGWGKTTFLHRIYRSTVNSEEMLPILITLRRPNAVDDLERYVETCSKIQKKQHRACTLLLVDGYDEISIEQRRRVSELILRYQAHRVGKFYLTCREYYEVSQLSAPEVRINAFSREDQIRFVDVFLTAFGFRVNAEEVISQLETRGFAEFLSHPLLLTLACIVKTSSSSVQPRSGLRLLQRALEVLCYQWDEQKSIDRQQTTKLDGQDRLEILKNIAYRAKSPFVRQQRAEEIARKQLSLMGMDRIDPRHALVETARFYGILVPSDDGYEFVHRTIHDFLAAKHWVESGDFARETKYEWNARSGYAACFVSDCTDVLQQALAAPDGLPAATEIISNFARFDMGKITEALIAHFSKQGRVLSYERKLQPEITAGKYDPAQNRVVGQLESDFVRLANSRFLDFIIEYCCDKKSPVEDLLVAYAAVELYERRMKLGHQTFQKALEAYKNERFTFVVPGGKQTQLGFLNKTPSKRLIESLAASKPATSTPASK